MDSQKTIFDKINIHLILNDDMILSLNVNEKNYSDKIHQFILQNGLTKNYYEVLFTKFINQVNYIRKSHFEEIKNLNKPKEKNKTPSKEVFTKRKPIKTDYIININNETPYSRMQKYKKKLAEKNIKEKFFKKTYNPIDQIKKDKLLAEQNNKDYLIANKDINTYDKKNVFKKINNELNKDFTNNLKNSLLNFKEYKNKMNKEKNEMIIKYAADIINEDIMQRKTYINNIHTQFNIDFNDKREKLYSGKRSYTPLNKKKNKSPFLKLLENNKLNRLKNPDIKNTIKLKLAKYKNIFNLIDEDQDGFISTQNIKLSIINNDDLEFLTPVLEDLQKHKALMNFKEFCIKVDKCLTNRNNYYK